MISNFALRHRFRAMVGAIQFLVLLCCSGSSIAAGELAPVGIVLTREASAAPFFLGLDAGYFKAEGFDPQLTFLKTDAAVLAAVASGKADIGMAALSAAFYGYAASHSLKIIASRSSERTGFPMSALLISRRAHAARLSGVRVLPNARIGITGADSGAYYGLFSIASRFKLDSGSIKTISFKTRASELGALARGDIDAALVPFTTGLHFANGGRSLLRLSDFAQWQEGVVFTRAEIIATRRSLIERFMRAYQQGTADYQLNFLSYDDAGDFIPGPRYDRYLKVIAHQAQISSDLLASTKTYCDRRANLDVADIEKQVRFWQDQGRVDEGIAASELVDTSFIGEENPPPH
jgi:NitT/TauT family transport system substrate-binding protein